MNMIDHHVPFFNPTFLVLRRSMKNLSHMLA